MNELDETDIPYLLQSIRDSLWQLVEQGRWLYPRPVEYGPMRRVNRATGAIEELRRSGEDGEQIGWEPLPMKGAGNE